MHSLQTCIVLASFARTASDWLLPSASRYSTLLHFPLQCSIRHILLDSLFKHLALSYPASGYSYQDFTDTLDTGPSVLFSLTFLVFYSSLTRNGEFLLSLPSDIPKTLSSYFGIVISIIQEFNTKTLNLIITFRYKNLFSILLIIQDNYSH